MNILMAVAAALATPSPSPSTEATSTVPFELDRGRIFVSVYVNGRGPYRFGFDTGASGVGRADARLTAELALVKAGEADNSDGIKVVTTDVVTAASVRLGDLEKRDVELLSRDYNKNLKPGAAPIMGIIGRDFFADRLVTINYPERTISLARGELRSGDPGVVPYSGSFVIPVCFGGTCYDGKVDTGSNRTLVLPKDVAAKIQATPPVLIAQVNRTNSVASLYEMTLTEPVRVGAITAAGQKAYYADPSEAVVNIGSDFLKDYVLTVDQQNRRLRIAQPAAR